MARDKKVQVRLSDQEYEALMLFSLSKGIPAAEVLRDYIKTLIPGRLK